MGQKQSSKEGRFHVLLIEDSLADVELIKFLVSNTGVPIDFITAQDGAEGSDALFNRNRYEKSVIPHLVLMDLNLPKKDGRDLLRELKADPERCKIPVIVISTSSQPSDVKEVYRLGAKAFICKLPDLDEYQKTIDALVDYWMKHAVLPLCA